MADLVYKILEGEYFIEESETTFSVDRLIPVDNDSDRQKQFFGHFEIKSEYGADNRYHIIEFGFRDIAFIHNGTYYCGAMAVIDIDTAKNFIVDLADKFIKLDISCAEWDEFCYINSNDTPFTVTFKQIHPIHRQNIILKANLYENSANRKAIS